MKIKSVLVMVFFAGLLNVNLFSQKQQYKLSLAEWSLHRTLGKGTISNLDFPRIAKLTYGLNAVEYVSTFFKGK